MNTAAYGVKKAKESVKPLVIKRRLLTEYDVLVNILYCGICHTDSYS